MILDTFYAKRRLLTREYLKRGKPPLPYRLRTSLKSGNFTDEPVKTLDPFHFVTGDTEESAKRAGLRQVQILRDDANSSLRGSRMCKSIRLSIISIVRLTGVHGSVAT